MTAQPAVTASYCRSCGACCVGGYDDGAGYATVTPRDLVRMSRHVRRQLVTIDHGAFADAPSMATPVEMTEEFGGICEFLRGTPGRRCSCRIYESRPEVCRSYAPGGESCLRARRELGLDGGGR